MWRKKKAKKIFSDTWCQYIFTLIMSNEIFRILSSFDDKIQNMITLKRITQNAWSKVNNYDNQILTLLKLDQKLKINDYEIQKKRIKKKSALNAKKKKLISTRNVELNQFNERKQKWIINQRLKSLFKDEETERKKSFNIKIEFEKSEIEHVSSVPETFKRKSYLKTNLNTRERKTLKRRKDVRTSATSRKQTLKKTTINQMILQLNFNREHKRRSTNLIKYDVQPQIKRFQFNITSFSKRVRSK